MCGNSICQDRRFLARWMPAFEDYFHYRNLDVSTLKELARRWKPDLMKGVPKEGKHEALADVLRVDRRAQVLPRKFHPAVDAQSFRASITPSPMLTRQASTRESSRILTVRLRNATVSGFWSAGSATVPLQSTLSMAIRPPARSSARQAS